MAKSYPHMQDTDFPNVGNVDVWKYQNDFDYSKYNRTQMRITICSVPWDVGLIHVGNAQIGGLGNVVYFESEAARDEYLDSIENKFTWETKYRAYHDSGFIEVDLPYERCVEYNYCYVEYDPLPVEWGTGGKNKFFFFIRSCEYLAPKTSKIEILRDTWQTYIYDINISYLMLERGHAPLSVTSADEFLADPVNNTKYLLADDANYARSYVSRYASNVVLNDNDMWAVIVTSSNILDSWGTALDDWKTPGGNPLKDGQPSMFAFAIRPSELEQFLTDVDEIAPQFKQTVKGVFFVSGNLVDVWEDYPMEFCGHDLYNVAQANSEIGLIELAKAQFGYGERYADLAKLYTYPYAYLEIADDAGNVTQVKIEETSGNLSLQLTTSLAYPWLAIDGHVKGIGTGSDSVIFSNVDSHSFDFSGGWYDHLHRWEVPVFAITQDAGIHNSYDTHFDRAQRKADADTTFANTQASLGKQRANAQADANTANADALARNANAETVAKRSAQATFDNATESATTGRTNADQRALTAYQNATASNATRNLDAKDSNSLAQTNSDRAANTDYLNAFDSATNAQTIGTRNAETAQTNALQRASAKEVISNRDNSAALLNAYDSADTAKGNADRSADADYNNAVDMNLRDLNNTHTSALTDYNNTLARNTLEKDNSDRSADAAEWMALETNKVVESNAKRSNEATNLHALDAADLAKANADRSADTAKDNAERTNNRVYENAKHTAETAYGNTTNLNEATNLNAADVRGMNTIIRLDADGVAVAKTNRANQKVQSDTYSDIALAASMAAISADLAMATTAMNTIADAVNGAISGAQNGALAGAAAGVPGAAVGALAGAGSSAIGHMASAAIANASIAITMTNDQAVLDAQALQAEAKLGYAQSAATDITQIENSFQDRQVQNQNTLNETTVARSIAASNAAALATHNNDVHANAGPTKTDADKNASGTWTAATTNARETNRVTRANANRTKTADDKNAEELKKTNDANATKRKDTDKANYRDKKIMADNNAGASYNTVINNSNATWRVKEDNYVRTRDTQKDNARDTRNVQRQNAKRTFDAKDENIRAEKALADSIATRDFNKDTANIADDYATSTGNALRTLNAKLSNNSDTRRVNDTIADRDLETDDANVLRTYQNALTENEREYNKDVTNAQRTKLTADANAEDNRATADAIAARDLQTDLANIARDYETGMANANRDKDNAYLAIENSIKQAALEAPKEFGHFENGETSITRPIGLFCNIVTQAQDAIEQAGDYFLRFGYALNRAWEFETFNLMPHFTYWKASDMWISGNNVPDKYLDEIRFYLLGGVCVWRNPDDIGRISIYEN